MASTEYKEKDLIVNFSLVDGMPEEIWITLLIAFREGV